ncbi:MAG: methyltransferase domain-containing protein [Alphaproteobacteria bacterium]|nr:methyltransferase domain-containing protein [Alphaproteobacteria bacterium]
MNRSVKISQAFSHAAETYDRTAVIQRLVAQKLAKKIMTQEGSSLGTVLEVGCGTGILSSYLMDKATHYVLTDLSPSLLQKAREKVRGDHILPVIVDGDYPCFTACFDIIVSSLALHWFQDPRRSIVRLIACLKPGGRLYLSTLGNNSFHEWRTAHRILEEPCGILDFMTFGQLKAWLPVSGVREVNEEWMSITSSNAFEFIHVLKSMGGAVAHPGHRALPYRAFKKVTETFDLNPQVSCQILYGSYKKPEKMREE